MEMSAGSIEVHTHMPAGCSMAILSVHALPPSYARPTRSSFVQLLSTHLHALAARISRVLKTVKKTDKFIEKIKLRASDLEIPDEESNACF